MAKTMADKAMTTEMHIRKKITHMLEIYPAISPTMLQAGLGPSIKAGMWRSHLEALKEEGIVIQDEITSQSPSGRYNTHRRLYLAKNESVITQFSIDQQY